MSAGMTRRGFLGVAAGGLALGFFGRGRLGIVHAATLNELRPGPFVAIAPDGTVEIVCHRTEMGQGIRSSLPPILADELGADFARVRVVQGDGDSKYGDQNTDGSQSVRRRLDELRGAAAALRIMLVRAAAQKLGVAPEACEARDHAVWHKEQSLPFASLVADAALLPVPGKKEIVLRPRAELSHLGKRIPVLDGPDIVTGKAQYGADVRLPGMLVAVILRPPTVWGRVHDYDPTRAMNIRGVRKIVEMPAPGGIAVGFQVLGGVAVVAENTWAAIRGRDELQVNWEMGPNADYDSAAFKQKLLDTVRSSAGSVRSKGDVEGALRDAAKVVTAEYYVPHLAHATMEPPAALANVTSAGCEVWAPTQNPQSARTEVARALGMSESKVTIHVTLAGGGFGRKSMSDFIVEAAILSRIMAAPVRVQWTRQDDLRHDYYHAVSAQRLEAAIDGAGNVTAWRQRTAFPTFVSTFFRLASSPGASELGMGLTDLPLAIPNVRMEAGGAKSRVRLGWLRSVCNIFHAFASGSFIDELAHARGRDPRDTWLELVGPPRAFTPKEAGLSDFKNYGESVEAYPIDVGRYRHVIERVTAMSDWGKPQKPGRALGLAAHRSFLSDVAVVVAVEKRPDGSIVVDEAWTVIDAGMVLNSDRVRAQMEGAVIFGMSIALYGEVTMKGGAVEQGSFRDYRLVRLPASPRRIHVEIVESDGPPRGVGEAGVPPVAPAIANAIFALTGERIRELPIAARLKV